MALGSSMIDASRALASRRFFSGRPKKFKETIVFTHHYGGSASSVRRHQEFVADLGYDSVAFDYSYNAPASRQWILPLTRNMKLGAKSAWIVELNAVLDSIEGDKIIFSFSFPSCATLHLLAESPRRDVKAWMTDGGPFLETWKCMGNFFKFEKPMLNPMSHFLATASGYLLMGGPFYKGLMHGWLEKIDANFPILSIRAEKDALVPESAIAAVFAPRSNSQRSDLNLQVLRLLGVEHMQGLKKAPELYSKTVSDFLAKVSLPLG